MLALTAQLHRSCCLTFLPLFLFFFFVTYSLRLGTDTFLSLLEVHLSFVSLFTTTWYEFSFFRFSFFAMYLYTRKNRHRPLVCWMSTGRRTVQSIKLNVNCMSVLVLPRTLFTIISLLYYKVCVISMSYFCDHTICISRIKIISTETGFAGCVGSNIIPFFLSVDIEHPDNPE